MSKEGGWWWWWWCGGPPTVESRRQTQVRPSVRFPLQQPHAVFHVVRWVAQTWIFIFWFPSGGGFHFGFPFPLRLPPTGWPDPDCSVHMRRAVGIGSAGDRLSLLAWTCLFLVWFVAWCCPGRGWARGDHDGVAVWW
ncbi:hypothetical protein B0T18DRAFT_396125 [Schizothecium vesticola]|uniref:Uncharacterized protein n=1 Tax=Schizothecium vesticola TaxID=314040 RepID=A0AA40F9F3_9PEZI|nr:hypothetical protein B0T18DRAFT_396125 [Schizothecium vesticola]